jgi:hypothetical protein
MLPRVATPQTGIFALGTMAHAYLELDRRPDTDGGPLVRTVAGLREPRTTIGGVNLVAQRVVSLALAALLAATVVLVWI